MTAPAPDQVLGEILGGRRTLRVDKRLDAMLGDKQGHRAFESMAEIGAVGGELIGGDILMGKGDFSAEENDQPAQLQPH